MPSLFSTTQEFVVNNEGWRSIRPKYKQLTYFLCLVNLNWSLMLVIARPFFRHTV